MARLKTVRFRAEDGSHERAAGASARNGIPYAREWPASAAAALVRAEGRHLPSVAFEREVVSFFVDAAAMLGVPKSVAAIYGICFASPQPLSFADITSRLDISQGSVSQGLRVLKEVGALKVIGTRERRDYFTPELGLRKLAIRFIDERLQKQLTVGSEKLKVIKATIPADENGASRELKVRLKYLQSWQDKSRALIPIVKTFLKLG